MIVTLSLCFTICQGAYANNAKTIEVTIDSIKHPFNIKEKDIALCKAMHMTFFEDSTRNNFFNQCLAIVADTRKHVSNKAQQLESKYGELMRACKQSVEKLSTKECRQVLKAYYGSLVDKETEQRLKNMVKMALNECGTRQQEDVLNGRLKTCAFTLFHFLNVEAKKKEDVPAVVRAAKKICSYLAKADTGKQYTHCYNKVILLRKRGDLIVPAAWIAEQKSTDEARQWCKEIPGLVGNKAVMKECIATKQLLLQAASK